MIISAKMEDERGKGKGNSYWLRFQSRLTIGNET